MTANAGGFLTMMGVTFAAFASGFGVCMFNMDTVGDCVAVANGWVGSFHAMGDHILAWGMSVVDLVMAKSQAAKP